MTAISRTSARVASKRECGIRARIAKLKGYEGNKMTSTVKLLNLAGMIETEKYEDAYALIRELTRECHLGKLYSQEEAHLNIMTINLLDCAAKAAGWVK